jgi:hypothetical protein
MRAPPTLHKFLAPRNQFGSYGLFPRTHWDARLWRRNAGQIAIMGDDGPIVTSLAARVRKRSQRCPLYKNATQVKPGEGLKGTRWRAAWGSGGWRSWGPPGACSTKRRPSVGGCRHCPQAGVRRGKRRLHKRPNAYEIGRCRWWQNREHTIVKPNVIVTLGATAARSVLIA